MSLDQRLHDAIAAGVEAVDETDDLFARVQLSIAEDRLLRQQRQRRVGVLFCITGAIAAIVAGTPPFGLWSWLMLAALLSWLGVAL